MAERLPFLDVLRQDLRYGLRRLRVNPTLTIAAVVTLAVGIGAVTSIYSFVDALVLHPLAYPDVDRVVASARSRRGSACRGIGVRMALGARDKQVVRILVAHGLTTTGVGLFIGLTIAFGLARLLAGWMAGTRLTGLLAVDGRVFLGLAAGMLLLAALSSWLPARRAAKIDPAATLRAD